jgi:high affinity cGMP-specific 3',5'-cyclic phosphodiesterase 9/high affinity cAMP-specific and IBMX-insensitive 3',5'-cyclic phosphodiesterase 8
LYPAVSRVESLLNNNDFKSGIDLLKQKFPKDIYESLKLISFDIWKYDEDALIHFMGHMFSSLDLISHFDIKENVLEKFLQVIRLAYNRNPFHNFKHCFSVTQMVKNINLDLFIPFFGAKGQVFKIRESSFADVCHWRIN